ncbi:hypothetical protein [Streptomyces sp. 11x1]|nr:hypothetical protein [Streptomyces sp. 11x1]WNZ10023.1 hypothetical protein P8T65_22105 [Streptomyces sp. 11x1]
MGEEEGHVGVGVVVRTRRPTGPPARALQAAALGARSSAVNSRMKWAT